MTELTWYGLRNSELQLEKNDFDMLLKFESKQDVKKNQDIKTYTFKDFKDNLYYL